MGVINLVGAWEDLQQPLAQRHCQLSQGRAQELPSAVTVGVTLSPNVGHTPLLVVYPRISKWLWRHPVFERPHLLNV